MPALAAISEIGDQPYRYCSHYNTKEAYAATYATDIFSWGDSENWSMVNNGPRSPIRPPISRRPPRRPKNSRMRTRLQCLNPSTCERCGGKGHNKRTSRQPFPLCHVRKQKRGDSIKSLIRMCFARDMGDMDIM
ncbi:Hypothetical predicted protein [Olea europaea subsp. europaea]|uniref:Uncharacterized protein n=1 Tax=Olea europaea subsp. europaea TaxID=158383 RepID=A0A8S0R807_OLEEU|nr:Hypothetical predicted protein [Olea europaea subsp. europaea]